MYDRYLLTVGEIAASFFRVAEKVLPYYSLSEFLRTRRHEDVKSRAENVIEREADIPVIFFRTQEINFSVFSCGGSLVFSLCFSFSDIELTAVLSNNWNECNSILKV